MSFEGKTAIITGAAQGIGRAVALEFAERGANLLLADIQSAKVESVAAEIRSTSSNRSTFWLMMPAVAVRRACSGLRRCRRIVGTLRWI
jgi:NAD(P)-dependent dehydrogenase (short-subunit alcohol dehydrogenase family)